VVTPADAARSQLVSILQLGPYLVASIHAVLDHTELVRFQSDVVHRVEQDRTRGVIIDVAAVDVLDSFATQTLSRLADAATLRGAVTVLVGIGPQVALAMVQVGLGMDGVHTAPDLDDAIRELNRLTASGNPQAVDHPGSPVAGAAGQPR